MDEVLQKHLEAVKLDHLIEVFVEQCITDVDIFCTLDEEDLKGLVPKIGQRAIVKKLQHNLKICPPGNYGLLDEIHQNQNQQLTDTNDAITNETITNETITNETISTCDSISTISTRDRPIIIDEADINGSPSITNRTVFCSTPASTSSHIPSSEPTILYTVPLTSADENQLVYVEDNSEGRNKRMKLSDDDGSTTEFINNKFNVHDLLNETAMGKAIIATYQANNYLPSKCQSYLVEILATYFLNNNFPRLRNNEFEAVARAINRSFPNEKVEVYFTPPVHKRHNRRCNKSVASKGKFTDKYRNKVTFLREAKVVPHLRFSFAGEEEESGDENGPKQPENDDDFVWLKSNIEPWNLVQQKWSNTFKSRCHFLQREDVNFESIFQEWPILCQNAAYTLIDEDFGKLFPGLENNLLTNFENVFTKLLTQRKQELNNTDGLLANILLSASINTEYRHYVMLHLIASLIPSKARISLNRKQQWRPTLEDCRNSLLARVEIPGDIQHTIEDRLDKCKKNGTPLLPFIIVEIEDNTKVKNVYVNVNETTVYKVPTVLKGIDVCFKLYHVLHLKYPPEGEHLWMFIQLGLYELKTKFDVNIPSILDIINKITL